MVREWRSSERWKKSFRAVIESRLGLDQSPMQSFLILSIASEAGRINTLVKINATYGLEKVKLSN